MTLANVLIGAFVAAAVLLALCLLLIWLAGPEARPLERHDARREPERSIR